jgi:hypothetical protein
MQIGSVLLLFVGLVIAILFMGFKVVPRGTNGPSSGSGATPTPSSRA